MVSPTPDVSPAPTDSVLRARLIAALRPRMTLVEAGIAVDALLPDVFDYATTLADNAVRAIIAEQAELVGSIVASAQDALELMGADP